MEQYRRFRVALFILGVIGVLVSIYLVNNHYKGGGSACDISQTISCSLANGSIYSKFMGIPVSVLGGVWFLVVLYLAYHLLRKPTIVIPLLGIWSIFGLVSVVYFIYAEISVRALCIACTIAHAAILGVGSISTTLYMVEKDKVSLWLSVKKEKWFILVLAVVMLIILIAFNWKYWFVY